MQILLFAATALAQQTPTQIQSPAAIGIGTPIYLPCGRLEWGWRNVWAICKISQVVPTGTPAPQEQIVLGATTTPDTVLTLAGQQALCTNVAGGTVRTKCRRALDAYGSLVRLCARGGTAAGLPLAGAASTPQMHAARAGALAYAAQVCVTPGAPPPSATNTCYGLAGWWGVVVSACNIPNAAAGGWGGTSGGIFTNVAPSALSPLVPNSVYIPVGAPSILQATVPRDLCTPQGNAPVTGQWNYGGVTFRGTRCRRALDQLGRQAQICVKAAPQASMTDYARFVGLALGMQAPKVCAPAIPANAPPM